MDISPTAAAAAPAPRTGRDRPAAAPPVEAGAAPRVVASSPPPGRPLLRLLRSAGVRFAALFAALFLGAILAFAVVLWWGTAGALDRQSDAVVRADALALAERWREAGANGTAEAIEERLAVDVESEAIYMLLAPDGRRVAGNLDRWPQDMPEGTAWASLAVSHDGQSSEARLHTLELPDGWRLLVGRDVSDKARLRILITEGLVWAGGFAALFALAGAWLLRRSVEGRLRPAYATAAAIASGDLSHRVPLSGQGDEFDRLAATMNAMLDRIDRLMEGVRGVSDAIAHDLRTPIARARAKLEDALGSAPEQHTAEGRVLRAAVEEGIADLDNISRIFQALLRIAEAEAGARRAAFAPLDLAPLLEDAAELYSATAEARGLTLRTDLPGELRLTGDRDLLLQAVANLLDNAVKFTPPDGTVRLSARARPDGGAEVSVADDGPGLAPQDRARAGERFFRADAARATPGSGLGLSLVQAVAHLHGGELVLADAAHGGGDDDGSGGAPGLRATLRLGPG